MQSAALDGAGAFRVVFQRPGPCPLKGARLWVDLSSLCQDTGHWTEATHWAALSSELAAT